MPNIFQIRICSVVVRSWLFSLKVMSPLYRGLIFWADFLEKSAKKLFKMMSLWLKFTIQDTKVTLKQHATKPIRQSCFLVEQLIYIKKTWEAPFLYLARDLLNLRTRPRLMLSNSLELWLVSNVVWLEITLLVCVRHVTKFWDEV